MRSFLSTAETEILISAFFFLVQTGLLQFLIFWSSAWEQVFRWSENWVFTRTRRLYHITPILASPHWLPIHIRSDYKVLLMTYKTVHSLALSYMSDLITSCIPTRALRSQNSGLLTVPKSVGCNHFQTNISSIFNWLNMCDGGVKGHCPIMWWQRPSHQGLHTYVHTYISQMQHLQKPLKATECLFFSSLHYLFIHSNHFIAFIFVFA